MSQKDPTVFISHILDCIEKVEEYLKGRSKEDFLNCSQLQDAVVRRVEIIGEAAKNIPDKIQEEYPSIKWKEAQGMRNILIHEYFGVDLDLTWQVAKKDLPMLKEQMVSLKEDLSDSGSDNEG